MQQRELDPSASVPSFFGAELRRYRKAAGLTQDELGKLINYTGSLMGQVETALRRPVLAFAEICDRVLDTGGFFARLWPLLRLYPPQCDYLAELEVVAVSIRSLEPLCIPGLLQTPEYARALLRARAPRSTPEHLDQAMIQVIAYDAGAHAGLDDSLTLLAFEESHDVRYLDSHGCTMVIESPEQVAACNLTYDLARVRALSPEQSADFIWTVMEDLQTRQ